VRTGPGMASARDIPVVKATFLLLPVEPSLAEIVRYCGYPDRQPPPAEVECSIAGTLADATSHLRPKGTYSVYPVTARSARSLSLGGVTIHGQVARFLEEASRVAAFVVTAGRELSDLVAQDGRTGGPLRGWVLDALGSWAAEAAAEALMRPLALRLAPDEALTLRYSPGYCGMDLEQQQAIFRLVEADSIGVSLLPSRLMHPLKSVSGLVGLVPRSSVGRERSPCERCPELGCHVRR
jgi:hypothetical protein